MYRTLHRFRGFRWRGSWILPCPESGSRGFRPEASSIEKPWSGGGCLAWGDGGRSFSAVAGAEHGTEERGHGSGEVRGKGARVPLKPWQQALVAAGSAVGALLDPARADLVGALGETTGGPAFRGLLERMKRSDEGRRILLERPRVMSEFVSHAWDLPPNTFGAAYARFMGTRNFSPDDRPPVRFLEQDEVAYVATRAREVHDFWHVLFNVPTSVLGELALKMVEFQQTLLPMCFLSVAGASWRLKPEQRELLFKHYFPWAVQAGKSCDDLICIYYEKYFAEDLEEVRKRWGIIPAPPRPNRKNV